MSNGDVENNYEGAHVIITRGGYRGCEGTCLGKMSKTSWAVSPDSTDEIIELKLEKDFSLLLDLSSDPTRN